jgi:hypothetical protein
MNPAAGQVPKDTGNGMPPGGEAQPNKGGELPVPQPQGSGSAVTWKHPAVLAAAGGVVVVVGAVALYNASQQRDRRRLEEALEAQEEQQ